MNEILLLTEYSYKVFNIVSCLTKNSHQEVRSLIELSNGHNFEYMAASGALGFDGQGWFWERPLKLLGLLDPSLFTIVIKTLTLSPRKGNLRMFNPFGCIRLMRGGTINAVGLTNPGIEYWCDKIAPRVDFVRNPITGSIFGEPDELVRIAKMLNDFDLVALEINASCPNTGEDLTANADKIISACGRVKQVSRFPLILKLSVVHNVEEIVDQVKGIIQAFSINSVPWAVIFPNRRSPLAHLGGGGVSGRIVQPYTWALVKRLARLSEIPIIGPSVWDYGDIERVRSCGASAIAFGSVFIPYPWRPTLYARRDNVQRSKGR